MKVPTKFQGIYAIRNRTNGKCYIGSTSNLYIRSRKHLYDLMAGRHHSPILQNSFNKHGERVFSFELIEPVSDSMLLAKREQYYIDTIKPAYNVSLIAGVKTRLGMKSSPEHCAHMSAALMGRISPMKGKHFTKKHKQNLSKAHKGRSSRGVGWHHSKETKNQISLHHNIKSNPIKSEITKKRLTKSLFVWWRSPAGLKRIKYLKTHPAVCTVLKKSNCVICNKKIVYKSLGKSYVKKTCCPEHLRKLRIKMINSRRKENGQV